MEEYDIIGKLKKSIGHIWAMFKFCKDWIRFDITLGVEQGSVLSLLLFMECIIKNYNEYMSINGYGGMTLRPINGDEAEWVLYSPQGTFVFPLHITKVNRTFLLSNHYIFT